MKSDKTRYCVTDADNLIKALARLPSGDIAAWFGARMADSRWSLNVGVSSLLGVEGSCGLSPHRSSALSDPGGAKTKLAALRVIRSDWKFCRLEPGCAA